LFLATSSRFPFERFVCASNRFLNLSRKYFKF